MSTRRIFVACVAILPASVSAHPGGTDSSGCHVQSSTGSRHCHGDAAEGVDARLVAEAAIEVGSSTLLNGGHLTYHGSYHLQVDGTMLFLAGFGGGADPMRYLGGYYDMNLGVAWIEQSEVAAMAKFGLGVRTGLFDFGDRGRGYLKIGAFMDLIFVPGGKALGLNATIGVLL